MGQSRPSPLSFDGPVLVFGRCYSDLAATLALPHALSGRGTRLASNSVGWNSAVPA